MTMQMTAVAATMTKRRTMTMRMARVAASMPECRRISGNDLAPAALKREPNKRQRPMIDGSIIRNEACKTYVRETEKSSRP